MASRAAPGRVVLVGTYKGDIPEDAERVIVRIIGFERAGIYVVIANEIMPDFAATLAANHPDTDVVTEAIYILEAA